MGSYRISQLAERSGIPATTLRFYESIGLLPAERSPSGYRVYGDESVDRLAFITSAKQLGLPLQEIRQLLEVWPDGACAAVRARMLPLVGDRIDETGRRIAELTAFAGHLTGVHQQLSEPAPAGPCAPGCGCVTNPGGDGGQTLSDETPSDETPSGRAPFDEAWRSQPVACALDGSSMSGRVQDWHRLLESSTAREPITDGLRLTFPADPLLAVEVTRLAAAEQDCCAFFDFTLQLTPAALMLTVRAPEAAVVQLSELFGATA